MAPGSRPAAAGGFTLIETMIVVALAAILVAVGGPSLVDMIKTSRVRSAASEFYAALLSARSEAIKRRSVMTVSPTSANWAQGWTITYSSGGSKTLVSHEALGSDVAVQVNVPAASASAITYGTNGRISSGAPALIFYIPADAKVQARCVTADPSGMPRMSTDTNGVATDGCN